MLDGLYRQTAAIEDEHWWFLHRRSLVRNFLAERIQKKNSKALDVGCGTGGNLKFLSTLCDQVTGIEKSPLAIELARAKGNGDRIIEGDANHVADFFPAADFDVVTLFNVLYHQWVTNDEAVLQQLFSLTRKGGYIVISEPAFNFLWRSHDESVLGKRRYTLSELERMLQAAGYRIRLSTYFNSFSFFPLVVVALFHRLVPNPHVETLNELKVPPSWVTQTLHLICRLERAWIRRIGRMPIGVTALCIAQKE